MGTLLITITAITLLYSFLWHNESATEQRDEPQTPAAGSELRDALGHGKHGADVDRKEPRRPRD